MERKSAERKFILHQTGLTGARWREKGAVFHENVSTLNLAERMKEKGLIGKFDLVVARDSFYSTLPTNALLNVYRVLRPGGKAVILFSDGAERAGPSLEEELRDLKNQFSYSKRTFSPHHPSVPVMPGGLGGFNATSGSMFILTKKERSEWNIAETASPQTHSLLRSKAGAFHVSTTLPRKGSPESETMIFRDGTIHTWPVRIPSLNRIHEERAFHDSAAAARLYHKALVSVLRESQPTTKKKET
ncbi:MAG: hypothetical protein HY917_05270 [Candidatus Diapherotrites archaeon]|nr:hypothetical protein [Candidatus Diapherotrites archaeon]